MRQVEDKQLSESLNQADPLLPSVCVHDTYSRHVESIQAQRLLAGGRKHVHFAPFELGDKQTISDMRYNCDADIYINQRTRRLRRQFPSSVITFREASAELASVALFPQRRTHPAAVSFAMRSFLFLI